MLHFIGCIFLVLLVAVILCDLYTRFPKFSRFIGKTIGYVFAAIMLVIFSCSLSYYYYRHGTILRTAENQPSVSTPYVAPWDANEGEVNAKTACIREAGRRFDSHQTEVLQYKQELRSCLH